MGASRRLAQSFLTKVLPRSCSTPFGRQAPIGAYFSSITISRPPVADGSSLLLFVRHEAPLCSTSRRGISTAAGAARHLRAVLPADTPREEEEASTKDASNTSGGVVVERRSEYWGNIFIDTETRRRADGSPWPWHCFRPADAYSADLSIDTRKHYKAEAWVDKLALWTVKACRIPVDLFFKERHVSHALLLETVAAVPGMVGGMLLHCKSLRRFEQSGGWIRVLLDEAENERMHLMTWVEVLKPAWWERALVLAVQGAFFNAYFALYVISPRLSHRFVAYLEEEAVRSYTDFLHAIDAHHMPNSPAPLIAIDYWRLPSHATIRDVVMVIRADEAHHRDVNHFAADVYMENRELRGAPAPMDYH